MKRVLLVEDDAETRAFLEIVLRDAEYDVVVASDGLDGYRKALEYQPDLVVTDLMMPVMDGVELAAVLRSHRPIPVVLITAHKAPEHWPIWDEYFDKPLEVPKLLDSVARLLNKPTHH